MQNFFCRSNSYTYNNAINKFNINNIVNINNSYLKKINKNNYINGNRKTIYLNRTEKNKLNEILPLNTPDSIELIENNVLTKRVQIIPSRRKSNIDLPLIKQLNQQVISGAISLTNNSVHGIKVKYDKTFLLLNEMKFIKILKIAYNKIN